MTNKELQQLLKQYPDDLQIHISERHEERHAYISPERHKFSHIEKDDVLWLCLDPRIFEKQYFEVN
jgi:hypothetical protein